MKVIQILSAAREDLLEGYRFYERQAEGIGRYFLDSLYADIESLRLYAGIHPVVFDRYHRMLARCFPYSIYYRCEDDQVLFYAVLGQKRSPTWLQARLSGRK